MENLKPSDISLTWTFRGKRREAVFPHNAIMLPFASFLRYMTPPKRGTRILDVGACVGAFTLPYMTLDEEATTTMIEPSMNALPYLHNNCGDLGEIIEVAVSSHEGYATLSNRDRDTKSAHGCAIGSETLHGEGINAQEVRLVRLDDIINSPVDLMKVDVEGHEIDVFRGAERLMLEYHPLVLVEMKDMRQQQAGHTTKEVANHLIRLGYDQPTHYFAGDYFFQWEKR